MKKIKKQLLLFSFVLFMGFVLCSAASAVQYADVAVNSIDCAVSSDGATAEFSINIGNKGTITAQNVVLRDKMAGVDVSQSQYSINNGEWQNWNKNYINLGTMTAGQTMLIEFKAPITSNALINKAELTTTTSEFNRYNNRLSYTTQATYTITSTAGTGGTINPNGYVNVVKGYSKTFNITPDTGWEIADVTVDGIPQGAINSYTFNDVQANHIIAANFSRIYTITATAGQGGSINPIGSVNIDEGDSQSFTITAENGYWISDVVVDGVSQGPISAYLGTYTYTFNNVQGNHTISAIFGEYIINLWMSITGSANGSLSPFIGTAVPAGGDTVVYTITPGTGVTADLYLDSALVESWVGPDSHTYQLTNVQSNHWIGAAFYYA